MKFREKLMVDEYLDEAPIASKGWTETSVNKFGETIGKSPDEKGFFEACVKRMKGRMGDKAEGFCAAIKDRKYNSTYWRNKKTKKDLEKSVKNNPYK